MTYVIACFLAPLVLLALSLGSGLLVDRVAKGLVPGALLPALGFALLVAVGQLTTGVIGAIAPVTPFAMLVLAVAGLWLGRERLRSSRIDWWLVGVSVVVYLVALGPVLASFRATLPAYLLDTTVGVHLAGAKQLLVDGRDFTNVPTSAFRGSMTLYFGASYPSGIQVVLGSLSKITFQQQAIWLYQPFLAAVLAMSTPVLYQLARHARAGRNLALAAAGIASVPALTYAYLQMGAIKEIGLIPEILLIGALLPLSLTLLKAGPRGIAPVAVACAGGLGAIGLSFAPWVLGAAAFLVVVGVLAVRRRELAVPALATTSAVAVGGFVLLALPTVIGFANSLALAKALSQSNAALANDPGNLLRPLEAIQVFGVWLSGTHRTDPLPGSDQTFTTILIVVMAVGLALGIVQLIRRRSWSMAAFLGTSLVLWYLLTARGTDWTDAKLIVLTSPIVVVFSVIGLQVVADLRRRIGPVVAALGVAVLAAGVLVSAAKIYRDTNLLPTDRYRDLASVASDYGGRGRTLTPDFDEYALSVLGAKLPVDGPGLNFRSDKVRMNRGVSIPYGGFANLDQFALPSLLAYRTIVTRTGPEQSRPPSTFRLARSSPFYEVWTATDRPRPTARLVPREPGGEVSCRAVGRFARADRTATLRYATAPPEIPIDLRRSQRSPGFVVDPSGTLVFLTPGRLTKRFQLPVGGPYRLWLKGDIARKVEVSIDGRRVGSIANQSGGDGAYPTALRVTLRPGAHTFKLERPTGSLAPADHSASRLLRVVLEGGPAGDRGVTSVPATRWRELCGQRLEWVERAPRR